MERLIHSLAEKIADLVQYALVDILVEAAPSHRDSAQILLQDAITIKAPGTPKRFKESILNLLGQKSNTIYALVVTPGGKQNRTGYASALGQDIKLGTSAAPLTMLKDRGLAAAEGLLLARNPWDFARGAHLEQDGGDFIWLHTIGQSPLHPHNVLYRTDKLRLAPWEAGWSKLDTWSSPTATQRWRVFDPQFNPRSSQELNLDFYFTFNSRLPWQLKDLTKLCTVTWELKASDFNYLTRTRRWGRRVHSGSLDFTVQFIMQQSFLTGPRFVLRSKGEPPRLATSVKWHCEPPFVVWPAMNSGE